MVKFGSTNELGNHFHGVHRKFDDEISALKSLNIGQQISLQSKCKFCPKQLLNRHVLKYHYEKVHKMDESKKNWECEFCKKGFKAESGRISIMRAHMRDDHDLPEYNCLEGKVASESKSVVGNQAMREANSDFGILMFNHFTFEVFAPYIVL